MNNKDLVIGFDIGTSSIKMIVLNFKSNFIELELKKSTDTARIISETNPHFNEQNVEIILELTKTLFDEIPKPFFKRTR